MLVSSSPYGVGQALRNRISIRQFMPEHCQSMQNVAIRQGTIARNNRKADKYPDRPSALPNTDTLDRMLSGIVWTSVLSHVP
jgi:hypothetical protein